MSFHDFLMKKGYTYEESSAICIRYENDLPMTNKQEELCFTWWNEVIKERIADELEKNNRRRQNNISKN